MSAEVPGRLSGKSFDQGMAAQCGAQQYKLYSTVGVEVEIELWAHAVNFRTVGTRYQFPVADMPVCLLIKSI